MSETQITNESPIKFPSMFPGYALGIIVIGLQLMITLSGIDKIKNDGSAELMSAFPMILSIGAQIYWFVCVYKTHKNLMLVTKGSYPVSAAQAVGLQFLPFYNIYWMFKWPAEIIDFVSTLKKTRELNRLVPGLLFGAVFILSWTPLGWLQIFSEFAVLGYLIKKINEAITSQPNDPCLYLETSGKAKHRLGGGAVVAFILLGLISFLIVCGIIVAIVLPNFMKGLDGAKNRPLSDAEIKQKLEQVFSNKTEQDKPNPSSTSSAN